MMMRSLICSTILTLTGFTMTWAQVSIQDSMALVALYNATDGDNWKNNDNWLNGPVSEWFGVTVQGDRVVAIKTIDNGLVGFLTEELAQLTKIQAIEFYMESFSGSIPDMFGQMSELYQIELRNCGFSGEIPPSLGNCPQLGRIVLHRNNLTGIIPSSIAACSQLTQLDLGDNNLSGPFPEVIQSFQNLEQLSLSKNNFSGTLPEWIASLTNLYGLYLNDNTFSGPAPFLGNKPNLTQLNISNNQLTGNLEDVLGVYPNLQYCTIINTHLSGELSPSHFNPDKIAFLVVKENLIHTLGDFTDWAAEPNFLRLDVASNNLDFDDLLPNSTMPNNKFVCSPQNPIGTDTVITLLPGEAYTIYSPMQDQDIEYQWYFNQVLIIGPDEYDLIIDPFTSQAAGDFHFTATHPSFPNALLVSAITTLEEETTALNEIEASLWSIYPNPASDFVIIKSEDFIPIDRFQLYSFTGQLLVSFESQQPTTTISFADFNAGIYFLHWITSNGTGVKTIVKR